MSASLQSRLKSLHNEYLYCVENTLSEFLAQPAVAEPTQTKEFCVESKNAYFEYMRNNFRTQYDNIIRLESQNF